ncbi:hypothetical protein E4A51_10790 [Cellulomonas sp. HD19AZ1]|nr:hypothetical protein E4A51_10790 [Cellulomonas sp. HD19AZ1]
MRRRGNRSPRRRCPGGAIGPVVVGRRAPSRAPPDPATGRRVPEGSRATVPPRRTLARGPLHDRCTAGA